MSPNPPFPCLSASLDNLSKTQKKNIVSLKLEYFQVPAESLPQDLPYAPTYDPSGPHIPYNNYYVKSPPPYGLGVPGDICHAFSSNFGTRVGRLIDPELYVCNEPGNWIEIDHQDRTYHPFLPRYALVRDPSRENLKDERCPSLLRYGWCLTKDGNSGSQADIPQPLPNQSVTNSPNSPLVKRAASASESECSPSKRQKMDMATECQPKPEESVVLCGRCLDLKARLEETKAHSSRAETDLESVITQRDESLATTHRLLAVEKVLTSANSSLEALEHNNIEELIGTIKVELGASRKEIDVLKLQLAARTTLEEDFASLPPDLQPSNSFETFISATLKRWRDLEYQTQEIAALKAAAETLRVQHITALSAAASEHTSALAQMEKANASVQEAAVQSLKAAAASASEAANKIMDLQRMFEEKSKVGAEF
ncbi:hypothetical protein HWV62_28874 [Athelia sp. TMB]|nr:hypothetical protein HWV62_28874 [Athelia sp. TMB]